MELTDKDLASIQEVRNLIRTAKAAQAKLAQKSQEEIDKIIKAMAEAAAANAEKLAKMAVEETGFGIWQDKVIKNIFGSTYIYDYIKDLKTVGIVAEDEEKKVMDVAIPMGVIAGLIPSTNPTSTTMYKALISLKCGNAIVFSPHPNAKNSILETVKIMNEAAVKAGCPEGAIGCITIPTLQATDELMKNKDTAMILATGGSAMVRAAYSSGTPALGVGPGNGPAFIDKSADIKVAVKRIMDSKTFDNGTICASEQSIIIEEAIKDKVVAELKNQGAYFLSPEEAKQLGKFIMRANGSMNPQIVGKSVETIAKLASLTNVPASARVLIAEETEVGHNVPYSREKLAPILGFYVEKNVDAIETKCREILLNEGAGHTFSMHCEDKELVKRFALSMPVSRIPVNTPSTLGGIGASLNIVPALTLGCGAIGGSATSDNVGPLHLVNIKKVAYGVREIEHFRGGSSNEATCSNSSLSSSDTEELVNLLVKKIISELR
ncbi:acetaldehyde dehydrogenase (acetylating) [Clostridium sp. UBA1056]|uniref:acetaldehyde dehydrogenase (acetylating) n=1 Tax=unclassified Clostridium TaxID=2614128 RepID=UPI00321662FE